MARALSSLIRRAASSASVSLLRPAAHRIVAAAFALSRDPAPIIRIEGCHIVRQVSAQLSAGFRPFAVGLAKSLGPGLNHRLWRVRVASIDALDACVSTVDPLKRKGAGTEALQALVGFREENVIPIRAFYKGETTRNRFAPLALDPVPAVRSRFFAAVAAWLLDLPDRMDHESRLAPYLLTALNDADPAIADAAASALFAIGARYEDEQGERLLDRLQHGVDGDGDRVDYARPLPPPFGPTPTSGPGAGSPALPGRLLAGSPGTGRPRLGARLWVRAQVKRFLGPLMAELADWTASDAVRGRAACLMSSCLCFLEEHATAEAHLVVPALVRLCGSADLASMQAELAGLCGRFLDLDATLPLLLPLLPGCGAAEAVDVARAGATRFQDPSATRADAATGRRNVASVSALSGAPTEAAALSRVLRTTTLLVAGAKPERVLAFAGSLCRVLSDAAVLGPVLAAPPTLAHAPPCVPSSASAPSWSPAGQGGARCGGCLAEEFERVLRNDTAESAGADGQSSPGGLPPRAASAPVEPGQSAGASGHPLPRLWSASAPPCPVDDPSFAEAPATAAAASAADARPLGAVSLRRWVVSDAGAVVTRLGALCAGEPPQSAAPAGSGPLGAAGALERNERLSLRWLLAVAAVASACPDGRLGGAGAAGASFARTGRLRDARPSVRELLRGVLALRGRSAASSSLARGESARAAEEGVLAAGGGEGAAEHGAGEAEAEVSASSAAAAAARNAMRRLGLTSGASAGGGGPSSGPARAGNALSLRVASLALLALAGAVDPSPAPGPARGRGPVAPERVVALVAHHARALWTSALAELPSPTSWSIQHPSICLQAQLLELCPRHVSAELLRGFAPVLVDLACRACNDLQRHFVDARACAATPRTVAERVEVGMAGSSTASAPPVTSASIPLGDGGCEVPGLSSPEQLLCFGSALTTTLAPLRAVFSSEAFCCASGVAPASHIRAAALDFLSRLGTDLQSASAVPSGAVAVGSAPSDSALPLPGWCLVGPEGVEAVASTVSVASALLRRGSDPVEGVGGAEGRDPGWVAGLLVALLRVQREMGAAEGAGGMGAASGAQGVGGTSGAGGVGGTSGAGGDAEVPTAASWLRATPRAVMAGGAVTGALAAVGAAVEALRGIDGATNAPTRPGFAADDSSGIDALD